MFYDFKLVNQRLLDHASALGNGPVAHPVSHDQNYQLNIDGTGDVSVTIDFYGRLTNDDRDWYKFGSLTATGTDHAATGLTYQANIWADVRATISAISGVNATVNCWMCG